MGNQILSFVQQDAKNQGHIPTTKSVIRPIKYGIQRPAAILIPHDTKEEFKHNSSSFEHHHIQIQQNESQKYYKNREQPHYEAGDKRRMIRQLSEKSQSSYRKLHHLRSDSVFQEEIEPTAEFIKTDFRKPYERRNLSKIKFTEDSQITINYLPAVSNIISVLKPFQHELSLLDETKIKKIRLGHSGDIYKGQLNDFNQPHGFGMLIKQNGSTLIGKFCKGLAQGESFFIYHNGSYYKGNMVDSMANDTQGFFYSADMTYLGGFFNNAFHGNCQQIGDNYHFQGQYENNIRKKGIFSWEIKQKFKKPQQKQPNLSNQLKGSQDKGLKHIQNEISKVNQLQSHNFQSIPQYNYIYEGQFDIHQLFIGKGTLKDPQGTYLGEFYRGMKHGKGEYEYKSQIKYIGEYDSDQRSGFGMLKNCDGTIAYQGLWSNGLPNGRGCSYDLKGRKTQCQFIDGLPEKIVPLDRR